MADSERPHFTDPNLQSRYDENRGVAAIAEDRYDEAVERLSHLDEDTKKEINSLVRAVQDMDRSYHDLLWLLALGRLRVPHEQVTLVWEQKDDASAEMNGKTEDLPEDIFD